MYNRYIPENTPYTRVTEETVAAQREERHVREEEKEQRSGSQTESHKMSSGGQGPSGTGGFRLPSFLNGKDGLGRLLGGKEQSGLSGLLKTMRLDDLDAGDILLLLIILYLLVEGDDLELVISLGLVLIMGLGDKEKGEKEEA